MTMVDQICLGQVFTNDGRKIVYRQCWMVVCRTEDEDSAEYSIFPLLPTHKERKQAITTSATYEFDPDFLERHNGTFNVFDTTLQSFLSRMPEFEEETSLEDVLRQICNSVTGLVQNGDSAGEPFKRHLYLATTPITDDEKGILFLEFDDDTYRPEVRVAPLSRDHMAKYHDFVQTGRNWRMLPSDMTEEIFRRVDDQTINALNAGLNGLKRINQQTLGNDKKFEEYNLMNHLEELCIVPTIWQFGKSTRATVDAEVCYDLLATWQVDTDNGDIYANLNEIQVQHKVNMLGAGLIGPLATAVILLGPGVLRAFFISKLK